MKYFCNIHPHLFAGCGNNWTGGLRVRSISPISDIVSIQFCCDKWRLYEATGNDLSVTDFVGDSSPKGEPRGRQSVSLGSPSGS